MQTATNAQGLTIVNFGMGSANAATIMDLLVARAPKGVLFLGKCGGLKRSTELGHFILPIAAIRGEGTSDDYLPPEVPALPSFKLHKFVSDKIIAHGQEYRTGVVYTTNRRVWEWDGARNSWTRRDDVGLGPPNVGDGTYDPDRDTIVTYVGFYSQFEMKIGMWEFTSP